MKSSLAVLVFLYVSSSFAGGVETHPFPGNWAKFQNPDDSNADSADGMNHGGARPSQVGAVAARGGVETMSTVRYYSESPDSVYIQIGGASQIFKVPNKDITPELYDAIQKSYLTHNWAPIRVVTPSNLVSPEAVEE
jgi:hypothetical protein